VESCSLRLVNLIKPKRTFNTKELCEIINYSKHGGVESQITFSAARVYYPQLTVCNHQLTVCNYSANHYFYSMVAV